MENPTPDDVAIAVLESRRSSLLAQLAAVDRERRRLRSDLRHVDGALSQLLGHSQAQTWFPNLPRPVGQLPKRFRIDRWFKGPEFSRSLMDALRKAGGTATTGQLVKAVCEGKDMPSWAIPVATTAAEKTLRRFAQRGVVERGGSGVWCAK